MKSILYPIIVLALWTIAVLFMVPRARFRAARERLVRASDFAFGESERVPEGVRLPNRNYMNLLELPVLFYVACLTVYVTGAHDAFALAAAWAFVATRIAHSLVHLTYNNVIHRMRVFALGVAVLVALWVRIIFLL